MWMSIHKQNSISYINLLIDWLIRPKYFRTFIHAGGEALRCWNMPKVLQNIKFGDSITMDGELFSELKVSNIIKHHSIAVLKLLVRKTKKQQRKKLKKT